MTGPPRPDGDQATFWACAADFLQRPGVNRSTMMGLPCLRRDDDFFAAHDPRTGNLLVKLNQQRVTALVAAGEAEPFAPAGRRFRQWAAVPAARRDHWPALLGEAFTACPLSEPPAHAGSGRTPRPRET